MCVVVRIVKIRNKGSFGFGCNSNGVLQKVIVGTVRV